MRNETYLFLYSKLNSESFTVRLSPNEACVDESDFGKSLEPA